MEVLAIFGAIASIGGIIDIISRSISALRDHFSRYSQFRLKFDQMTGQLSTLKAVLLIIKQYVHEDIIQNNKAHLSALERINMVYYLESAVNNCQRSMRVLKDGLDQFEITPELSRLKSAQIKTKFVMAENQINTYHDMLNNEIRALNTVLNTMTWRSTMVQNRLLQMESSQQQVFERIRDDTSSLFLQIDKDSIISQESSVIDEPDLKDIKFGFDRELFSSKPYLSVTKSWMSQPLTSKNNQSASTKIPATSLQVNDYDSVISEVDDNDSVISDTATLIPANADEIDMTVDRPAAAPVSNEAPRKKISQQSLKASEETEESEKKTGFRMFLYSIPLAPPGSIRAKAAVPFSRRVAPPQRAYQQRE